MGSIKSSFCCHRRPSFFLKCKRGYDVRLDKERKMAEADVNKVSDSESSLELEIGSDGTILGLQACPF